MSEVLIDYVGPEYDLTTADWRSFPGPDPSRNQWSGDPRELEVWAQAYLSVTVQYFDYAYGEDHMRQLYRSLIDHWEAEGEPIFRGKRPIPRHLSSAVRERDGHVCQSCGSRSDLATDHLIPESKGGPAVLENLQTLCKSCNSSKGSRL